MKEGVGCVATHWPLSLSPPPPRLLPSHPPSIAPPRRCSSSLLPLRAPNVLVKWRDPKMKMNKSTRQHLIKSLQITNPYDIVFHKSQKQTCLRILFRATYLARTWMLLQKEEDKDTISTACRAMESTAMEIFTKNGWLFSNRLCL